MNMAATDEPEIVPASARHPQAGRIAGGAIQENAASHLLSPAFLKSTRQKRPGHRESRRQGRQARLFHWCLPERLLMEKPLALSQMTNH